MNWFVLIARYSVPSPKSNFNRGAAVQAIFQFQNSGAKSGKEVKIWVSGEFVYSLEKRFFCFFLSRWYWLNHKVSKCCRKVDIDLDNTVFTYGSFHVEQITIHLITIHYSPWIWHLFIIKFHNFPKFCYWTF